MKGWGDIMKNSTLNARMGDDPNLKELYFNAYYGYAWCWYKLSQTGAVIAKGKDKDYLKTAANHILRWKKQQVRKAGKSSATASENCSTMKRNSRTSTKN